MLSKDPSAQIVAHLNVLLSIKPSIKDPVRFADRKSVCKNIAVLRSAWVISAWDRLVSKNTAPGALI